MSVNKTSAQYPDLPWSGVTVGRFLPLIPEDFPDPQSITELCQYLFGFPEHKVYLFHPFGNPVPDVLRQAEDTNDIVMSLFERPYYRHRAGSERTFTQIPEASQDGVEYVRIKLKLSEARRRAMEIQAHLQTAEASESDSPVILRPALWGIGIDLRNLWTRIKKWWAK